MNLNISKSSLIDVYRQSLDLLNSQINQMQKIANEERNQLIHFRNLALLYRISELEKILANNSFTIDEKILPSISEDELVNQVFFNIRVAEIIRLTLNDAQLAKINQREITEIDEIVKQNPFHRIYERIMSHSIFLDDFYEKVGLIIADATSLYSKDLNDKILNFDVDSRINLINSKQVSEALVSSKAEIETTLKINRSEIISESPKKESTIEDKDKQNGTENKDIELDLERQLINLRVRSQKINMQSNLVRNFVLFFTNYPAWLLQRILNHYNGVKNRDGNVTEIQEPDRRSALKAHLSITAPLAVSVLGLTTNVFQFLGLPVLNGIFTGVGMTIAARNLFEFGTFYFVNWRVNNTLRRINQDISNILGKEVSISELGKLSLVDQNGKDVYSLIGDRNVPELHAYLYLRDQPLLRYVRAISEKTVAHVVHSNRSINSIMNELNDEIQGIALLLAIRELTLYVEKRHVNLAKQLIYQEIKSSNRRSKVWAFVKWLSAAVLGIFVGILGYNVAKNCWNKDCSIFGFDKHNTQNAYISDQNSNDNLSNYLPTTTQYVVPIEECKEYTKKFVEFLVNNKDKLVHKTFGDIVTEFNGGNNFLDIRLIEGFDTNIKLSKDDIEKLITLFAKDNGETLAYHLHRVMGAKDALQMPYSDAVLKEVADSFNHAKLSPNEDAKWRLALDKLKEVVNQRAKGKFEVSMSNSVLRKV